MLTCLALRPAIWLHSPGGRDGSLGTARVEAELACSRRARLARRGGRVVTTAFAAGARRADGAYERFQAETGAPNLVGQARLAELDLTSTGPSALTRQVEAIDELLAIPGVERVVARAWWAVELEPSTDAGRPVAFATGIFEQAGSAFASHVVDGHLPGEDDATGVTINEEAVRVLGLAVGSRLNVRTVSSARTIEWASNDGTVDGQSSFDGPVVNLVVTGVVRGEDDFLEERFPAITLQEGFAKAHQDDIAVAVPEIGIRVDPQRIDELTPAIAAVLDRYDADVFPVKPTAAAIEPSVGVEVTTLRIAALVAAFAGAVALVQMAGRPIASVAEDDVTRSALGMSRAQRRAGRWLAVLPAVLVGAALVAPLAWLASGVFPGGVARLAELDSGRRFDAPTLFIGATLTLLVTLLVVGAVAVGFDRRAGAQHWSVPTASGRLGGHPALSLGAAFARRPGGGGRSGAGLALATMIGVALATGAVVTIATFEASRRHLEATPELYGAPTDLVLESNGSGLLAIADDVLATPGVGAVTLRRVINDDSMPAVGHGREAQVEARGLRAHPRWCTPAHDRRPPARRPRGSRARGRHRQRARRGRRRYRHHHPAHERRALESQGDRDRGVVGPPEPSRRLRSDVRRLRKGRVRRRPRGL